MNKYDFWIKIISIFLPIIIVAFLIHNDYITISWVLEKFDKYLTIVLGQLEHLRGILHD